MKHEDKLQSLIRSRRFWAAVGGVLVVVLNEGLGLGLSSEQVIGLTIVVGSWIVGDTLRETE